MPRSQKSKFSCNLVVRYWINPSYGACKIRPSQALSVNSISAVWDVATNSETWQRGSHETKFSSFAFPNSSRRNREGTDLPGPAAIALQRYNCGDSFAGGGRQYSFEYAQLGGFDCFEVLRAWFPAYLKLRAVDQSQPHNC